MELLAAVFIASLLGRTAYGAANLPRHGGHDGKYITAPAVSTVVIEETVYSPYNTTSYSKSYPFQHQQKTISSISKSKSQPSYGTSFSSSTVSTTTITSYTTVTTKLSTTNNSTTSSSSVTSSSSTSSSSSAYTTRTSTSSLSTSSSTSTTPSITSSTRSSTRSTLPSISSLSSKFTPPTTITPLPITSTDCCFVVQDTIDYRYWGDTSISTITYTVPSTDIKVHYTQYPDTVITDISTLVTDFTSSILVTLNLGARLPHNANPAAPTPTESGLSGATTVVYAQTVVSPSNFFIYRNARIIRVPPVTDQNGQVVCATSSIIPTIPSVTKSPLLFPGINSNAEQYFNGPTATRAVPVNVVTDISLSTPYLRKISTPAIATTVPETQLPSTGIFAQSAFSGIRGQGSPLDCDISEEDYGYVDPFFIQFLAQNSDYVRQYPEIATCLPGGPSIDPGTRHADLVSSPTLEAGLTNTVSSTDYAVGCFNTDSPECATAEASKSLPPSVATKGPSSNPTPPAPAPALAPSTEGPPAPPSFNPNSLSPEQRSGLFSALQPSSASPTFNSFASVPSPSPTSFETLLSPIVIPSENTPLPVESTPLPVGFTPLPVGFTPLPVGSTPLPGGSTPLSIGSTPLSGGSTPLLGKSTPLPGKSTPLPAESTLPSSTQPPPSVYTGKASWNGGEPLFSLLALCVGFGVLVAL